MLTDAVQTLTTETRADEHARFKEEECRLFHPLSED
jgi:hypothetical protein